MRWMLALLLALPQLAMPLAAQTWDLRLEVPFPKGQSLHGTIVSGTGQLASGDLDTGSGAIFSINHRLLRVGPVLRLEWGGELARWQANGNININNSNTFNSKLTQTGAGLGLNAQLWIPFVGICGEVGAIYRVQQYEFSSADANAKSDGTIGRTWLRVGARWRVPYIPKIHPYIAASYQQPINKEQPVNIKSPRDLAELFKEMGKGQEFQRMWTFGLGITF
jgi:hypothetical protein